MLISSHVGLPSYVDILASRMYVEHNFEHAIQFFEHAAFLVHALGFLANHIPLKCRCAIEVYNQIRHIYLNSLAQAIKKIPKFQHWKLVPTR
jgi:hypothetical protein